MNLKLDSLDGMKRWLIIIFCNVIFLSISYFYVLDERFTMFLNIKNTVSTQRQFSNKGTVSNGAELNISKSALLQIANLQRPVFFPDIIQYLSQSMRLHRLNLEKIHVIGDEVPEIQLQISGSYFQFLNWLMNLKDSPWELFLKSIKMQEQGRKLQTVIILEVGH